MKGIRNTPRFNRLMATYTWAILVSSLIATIWNFAVGNTVGACIAMVAVVVASIALTIFYVTQRRRRRQEGAPHEVL